MNFVLRLLLQGRNDCGISHAMRISLRVEMYLYIYLSAPLIFRRYEISREKLTNSEGEIFDNPETTNQDSPLGESAFSALIPKFRFTKRQRGLVLRLPNVLLSLSRTILYYIFSENVGCEINVRKCTM